MDPQRLSLWCAVEELELADEVILGMRVALRGSAGVDFCHNPINVGTLKGVKCREQRWNDVRVRRRLKRGRPVVPLIRNGG